MIYKSTIEEMGPSYPQPYKVFCVDNSFHSIISVVLCLFGFLITMIAFGMPSYMWMLHISCQVGPGCLARCKEFWEVKHIMFHVKRIMLTSILPKSPYANQQTGLVAAKKGKKFLHFVRMSYEHIEFRSKTPIKLLLVPMSDMPDSSIGSLAHLLQGLHARICRHIVFSDVTYSSVVEVHDSVGILNWSR